MMDWIQNYTRIDYQARPERMEFGSRDFHLERVETHVPEVMTAAGQFFTAMSVWFETDYSVGIPAFDEEVLRFILDEIAVHFTDVKFSFTGGKRDSVQMQGIRPGTEVLLDSTDSGILPVLKDLYREKGPYRPFGRPNSNPVSYTVISGKLRPYEAAGTEGLKWLLNKLILSETRNFRCCPGAGSLTIT